MRITLPVDDDLAAKLRDEMAQSQRSLEEVVNEFLRRGLRSPKDGSWATPFTVNARPMGLRNRFDLDDIGGLLEFLDGASRR